MSRTVLIRCLMHASCLLAGPAHATTPAPGVETYEGLCDASAAAALGADHFVVASDEDSRLRVYRRGAPKPVWERDFAGELQLSSSDESDIEAVGELGGRLYWITSHGNNRSGKARPERQRLFATVTDRSASAPSVAFAGAPFKDLLKALLGDEALKPLKLGDAKERAPEAGGINIEGLAPTRDGRGLLVGFRSPLVDGKALVVPLLNPQRLVERKPPRPRFGQPVLLDLGHRGVRSIERVGEAYLIAAGPVDDNGTFALYRWAGDPTAAPVKTSIDLAGLNVEAVFAIPQTRSVQLLSDDGGTPVVGKACKKAPQAQRAFRSLVVPTP